MQLSSKMQQLEQHHQSSGSPSIRTGDSQSLKAQCEWLIKITRCEKANRILQNFHLNSFDASSCKYIQHIFMTRCDDEDHNLIATETYHIATLQWLPSMHFWTQNEKNVTTSFTLHEALQSEPHVALPMQSIKHTKGFFLHENEKK